ncbi:hypothetical protein VTJ49DRAFT_1737 [Mycothermus thermophilus]|uniref:Cyanovirin-N domain-containing protein n=1 Tax=Humicola insolens TaxID=85995 RepID=A0ABR3VBJ7_HUMIN
MLKHNKLDLNKCLGVDKNGDLIFKKKGYFEQFCQRCSVTVDGQLHCECFRYGGGSNSIAPHPYLPTVSIPPVYRPKTSLANMRPYALFTVAAALLLSLCTADYVNFSRTCTDFLLVDGSILEASCCYPPCEPGMSLINRLNLNQCVGNNPDDYGHLIF